MSVKKLEELVSNLNQMIKEDHLGNPYFTDDRYKVIPVDARNFRQIKSIDGSLKLGFIDGGNQELFRAPNFSIQANRVYSCLFKGQQRVRHDSNIRIEFFSATTSEMKSSGIFFNTSLFPFNDEFVQYLPDEQDLCFDSFDQTIKRGMSRADISWVASLARRFAEWSYATHIIKDLDEHDVLVLDRALNITFTNESKYSNQLYETALNGGVTVTGLSKTSQLYTDKGLSLIGAILKFAETNLDFKSWYVPIAEIESTDHNAMIFIVKLNAVSNHAFRFDMYRKQYIALSDDELDMIFGRLAVNSCDISFPGYPYGLIDADNFARVSEADREAYKYLLVSEMTKNGVWSKFARHISAVDAHEVLNSLVG